MANENWSQAVGCVVLKGDDVLLVRHTYGNAKDKLLIPGGYCQLGEIPQDAALRELMEETKISATVGDLLAIRFNESYWYVVFLMAYTDGDPTSDHDENSEVVFMDIHTAINHAQITDLTKMLLQMALDNKQNGLKRYDEYTKIRGATNSLYGVKPAHSP